MSRGSRSESQGKPSSTTLPSIVEFSIEVIAKLSAILISVDNCRPRGIVSCIAETISRAQFDRQGQNSNCLRIIIVCKNNTTHTKEKDRQADGIANQGIPVNHLCRTGSLAGCSTTTVDRDHQGHVLWESARCCDFSLKPLKLGQSSSPRSLT
jgi:hypothetical protein